MTLTRRSASAGIWELGSVTGQAFLQFAVMALLARLIPPRDFGLYAIASMAVGTVAMFSEIGVGQVVIQRKELSDGLVCSAFTLSLLLGAFSAAAIWLASPLIAGFFGQPEVTALLQVVSITLIINGYTTVSTALLERDLHYRKLAIINVTSYAVGFGLLGSSLALLGVGAWAIIGATLSQNLTRAIMLRAMSTASVRWAISASDVKHLLVFGGGVTTGKLGAYAASQVDNIIVGRFIGAAGLGLYNMAFTIMDLPRRFLGSVIDRVGFAAMTRVQDDGIRLRAGYLQSLELANVTLLPLTVFLIIAAPEVVRVLLGTRWDAAVVPLQVLLTTVPLRASFRLACQLGTAVGRVYRIAALQYLYTAIIGVAALIGLQGGLVGVAAGVTVGVIGMWVIMTPVALRIVGASLRDYLAAWIPGCLVGAAVMVATGVAVSITRQNIESEIVRLALVSGFTALMVLVLLWTWPRAMGRTALRVVLDLGQGIPVLAAVTARLETSRVPDTQAGIADSVR